MSNNQKRLEINDTGLVDWLWHNSDKVEKANVILQSHISSEQKLAKLRQLLEEQS